MSGISCYLLFLVGTANAWTTTIPTDNARVSCHLQQRRNLFSSRHFVSFTGSCCLDAAVVRNKRLIKKGGQLERLSRHVNPNLMGLRAVESSENGPFSPDWDEETFSSTKLDFQNTDSNYKMPLDNTRQAIPFRTNDDMEMEDDIDIDESESVSIDLDDDDDMYPSEKFKIANSAWELDSGVTAKTRKQTPKQPQPKGISASSNRIKATFTQDTSSLDDLDEDYMYTTPSTSTTSSTSSSSNIPRQDSDYHFDDTQRKLQEQQRQIDFLMAMVKGDTPRSLSKEKEATSRSSQSPLMNPNKISTTSNSQSVQRSVVNPLPSWLNTQNLPYLDEEMGENELMEDESSDDTRVSFQSTPLSPVQTRTRVPQSLPPQAPSVMPLAPLKAMLFIDGTWLYYSLYRRSKNDCPIIRKFGLGWQYHYKFDWSALPRVLCDVLFEQESTKAWSSTSSNTATSVYNHQRPVEIVRASVFTSYFKTTDPLSFRVRMYNDMRDANYDIHQMETVGPGEKCVDIQLAVDMLHYATVTNAYDIAILLSGDKDFIPAMVRTRQKGRKVAVVSMRAGCNRALCDSSHIKDYDVVWIDDLLDQLIVPLHDRAHPIVEKKGILSVFTVSKVLYDFIINAPSDMVSSRDVGRYLKGIKVDENTTILEDLKNGIGGLSRLVFDEVPSVFEVRQRSVDESRSLDPRDKSYLIGIKPGASKELEDMIMKTEFAPSEKNFLKKYWANEIPLTPEEYTYSHHISRSNDKLASRETPAISFTDEAGTKVEQSPNAVKVDYSTLTVAVLKDMCRERKLAVTGKKADLIERLRTLIEESETESKTETEHSPTVYPTASGKVNRRGTAFGDSRLRARRPPPATVGEYNPLVSSYLEGLIKEFVIASGGKATSNNIGRYLNASNPSGHSLSKGGQTVSSALTELKESYGSLASFIKLKDDIFETSALSENGDTPSTFSFAIKLKQDSHFVKSK